MIELRKVQEKDRDLLWNINQKEVLLISIIFSTIVSRKENKNVVTISGSRYDEFEKAPKILSI